MAMPFIVPCVMYEKDAEKAANFYVAVFSEIFGDASILYTGRWGAEQMKALERLKEEDRPFKVGGVSMVRVRLNGQELVLGNGGPHFQFNDALSLYVSCDTQEQLDALWDKLSAGGGQPVECGWLIDKFGVRWQISTQAVQRLLEDKDPERAERAQASILNMKKIETRDVENAARGAGG
jgi:predicted 3-demethylubiquinone-9 3-methyltransferase (glyoxalase superfamily)